MDYILSYITLSAMAIFVFSLIVLFSKYYGNPFNPASYYLAFDSGLRVILSCAMLFIGGATAFKDSDITHALLLHFLYVFCFITPFFLRSEHAYSVFKGFIYCFRLNDSDRVMKKSGLSAFMIITFMAVNFIMLAKVGGGGEKWFLSPRDAYIENKFGAGNFYLFWVWSISLFMIYILYTRKPTSLRELLKISPYVLFCLAISYFTGSKQNILIIVLIIIFYYSHFIKQIKLSKFALIGVSLLSLFLAIQLIQGTTNNIFGALAYFDYFQKTIDFVGNYDKVGPKLGESFLSSFWGYIPRFIDPDKPVIYGQLMIQEALYPGAADQGYYPAFSSWSFLYLDFEWVGVMLSGLFVGFMSWSAYEFFRRNPNSVFAFSMAAQATITMYMVPLHGELYLVAWFIMQRIMLAPTFRRKNNFSENLA
jgi:oligosaccharide repeat unit polymerase